MVTDQQPRRRLLTARQMQRPKRTVGRTVSAQDSSVPEQTGTETAEKGSGDEGESGEGVGGREDPRGAAENQTDGTVNRSREPEPSAEMYGSYIDPVPVLIVGSHYDKLEAHSVAEAVRQTQELVDELREQFEEYLTISPRLYPLNCLSSVSKEIKDLKERLCEVRSELVEVWQPTCTSHTFNMSLTLLCAAATAVSAGDGKSGEAD